MGASQRSVVAMGGNATTRAGTRSVIAAKGAAPATICDRLMEGSSSAAWTT